jgi:hypothetical protein
MDDLITPLSLHHATALTPYPRPPPKKVPVLQPVGKDHYAGLVKASSKGIGLLDEWQRLSELEIIEYVSPITSADKLH